QISAGNDLPSQGTVFVTVNDRDKETVTPIVRRLHEMGFQVMGTEGTARYLNARGVPCERVFKVGEGRPHVVDRIISGAVSLLINTPFGKKSQYDDYAMRRAAITYKVPYLTTMSAATAAADAILALRSSRHEVKSVQERTGVVASAVALV